MSKEIEKAKEDLMMIIDHINKSPDSDLNKKMRVARVKDEYARKLSLIEGAEKCSGNLDG